MDFTYVLWQKKKEFTSAFWKLYFSKVRTSVFTNVCHKITFVACLNLNSKQILIYLDFWFWTEFWYVSITFHGHIFRDKTFLFLFRLFVSWQSASGLPGFTATKSLTRNGSVCLWLVKQVKAIRLVHFQHDWKIAMLFVSGCMQSDLSVT